MRPVYRHCTGQFITLEFESCEYDAHTVEHISMQSAAEVTDQTSMYRTRGGGDGEGEGGPHIAHSSFHEFCGPKPKELILLHVHRMVHTYRHDVDVKLL